MLKEGFALDWKHFALACRSSFLLTLKHISLGTSVFRIRETRQDVPVIADSSFLADTKSRTLVVLSMLGQHLHFHHVSQLAPDQQVRARHSRQVCGSLPHRSSGVTSGNASPHAYHDAMQVDAILSSWRREAEHANPSGRQCQLCSKRIPFSTAPLLKKKLRSYPKRLLTDVSCAGEGFGTDSITAGIPVSPANTAVGHQLWQALQNQPLDFIAQAQAQLKDVAVQSSTDAEDVQPEGVLTAARRRGLLEDILYYWALAEAYLGDVAIQSSLR